MFCTLVDFQKAFDYVNHDILLYKLFNKGIDWKIYNAVKAMYSSPSSCVLINDRLTDGFEVNSGTWQGDFLSPILLAVFIEAQEIRDTGLGLEVGDDKLALVMYADDIGVLGELAKDTQSLLDILSRCCFWWGMKANINKSQVKSVKCYRNRRKMDPTRFFADPSERFR